MACFAPALTASTGIPVSCDLVCVRVCVCDCGIMGLAIFAFDGLLFKILLMDE
jgi:hypothetical protein